MFSQELVAPVGLGLVDLLVSGRLILIAVYVGRRGRTDAEYFPGRPTI